MCVSCNIHYHHHHHQPINVPTVEAQAFPMNGIGRLGHDPPRGPSADWWVFTTANAAGTKGLTCLPKHGRARDSKFLVTHPMTDHCESCLTATIAAERANHLRHRAPRASHVVPVMSKTLLLWHLMFVGAISAGIPTNDCPTNSEYLLPHETNCSLYYQCDHGRKILKNCMPEKAFDSKLQECVTVASGGCTVDVGNDEARFWSPTSTYVTTPTTPDGSEDSTTTNSSVAQPNCSHGFVGFIPHPNLCDSFYLCWAGKLKHFFCEHGYEFDLERATCILIAPGGCTLGGTTAATDVPTTPGPTTTEDFTTASPICPPGFIGDIPHPQMCDAFFSCFLVITSLRFCAVGFEFDPARRTCILIAPGGCTLGGTTATTDIPSTPGPTTTEDFTTASPICPPGSITSIPHPLMCDAYFWCFLGTPSLQLCAVGFEFDPARATCVRIAPGGCTLGQATTDGIEEPTIMTTGSTTTQNFDTTTLTITTDSPICPPGFNGNVPHPQRCDAYFICNWWGIASKVYCSVGFEFHPGRGTCVRIAPGGCTLGFTTFTTNIPSTPGFSTSGGMEGTIVPSSTSAPPAPFCATGFMGTVPHPNLCNSFFMCLGSTSIQMYCTLGHEYNVQLRTCVQLAPGGCTLGNITTESPWITTTWRNIPEAVNETE
ncbi:hypothetical protein evm_012069 [Chilo suppressalis]|nr:hypothetical protein evm_012069 [Chilo suppressalis]